MTFFTLTIVLFPIVLAAYSYLGFREHTDRRAYFAASGVCGLVTFALSRSLVVITHSGYTAITPYLALGTFLIGCVVFALAHAGTTVVPSAPAATSAQSR